MASGVTVTYNGPALANLKKMFAVTGARRLDNTQGKEVRRHNDDDDTSGRARGYDLPSFFSQDVFDRFGGVPASRLLGGLMEDAVAVSKQDDDAGRLLGGVMEDGVAVAVSKQDDDAMYLKVSMPGLGKEHVKVWAEKNIVMIEGEGEKEPWGDDAAVPKYSGRVEMPAGAFKMDKIKAEMKNGVLRLTVPKIKWEERKDVFQVLVE